MLTSPEHATEGAPTPARGLSVFDPGNVGQRLQALVRNPWTYVCLLVLVVSIVIVRKSDTSPGYDPYGWLVWGYQGIRGTLSLAGAPSWKPVTFIFTLPYSIFGHYSYWLWVTTSATISFGGPVVAGRVAYRIVRPRSSVIWPAVIAALFAAIALFMVTTDDTGSISPYAHYVLSYQSDAMLVTFFLLAIDAFISGKYRWTHTWLLMVSLGRPEGWVVLGPFAVWAWFKHPEMRKLIIVELVVIPILWFGIPVICGQPWDVAYKLAEKSPRMLHGNKIIGVIDRYKNLSYWPVFAGAGIAIIFAAFNRNRQVLAVLACAVAWMICEIAFALKGLPGVSRYMFEAGAATIVLGGVGVGLLASWVANRGQLPLRGGAAVLALVLVGFMVPYAKHYWDLEHIDLVGQKNRTHSIAMLHQTISVIGGPHFVNSCGVPTVDVGAASILAWYTHNDVNDVGYIPKKQIRLGGPVVLFTSLYNGWVVHTFNLKGAAVSRCASLNNTYWVDTAGHPGGVLVHQ
jgi:hypothetical protein